jgi:hypothetical protein
MNRRQPCQVQFAVGDESGIIFGWLRRPSKSGRLIFSPLLYGSSEDVGDPRLLLVENKFTCAGVTQNGVLHRC